MIEVSQDPDVPSLVYCDANDGCNRWQPLSAEELPFGWVTVLEVGYPDEEQSRPMAFCSWNCLRRRAVAVCGGWGVG
jgi:hypothetical protein